MNTLEDAAGAALVLTTTSNDETARALARTLVEEGLAACVNRHSVRSTYRWESRLCEEDEVLLVIKTSERRVAALQARILALHSYACPEFVVLQPSQVEKTYLAWLLESCA